MTELNTNKSRTDRAWNRLYDRFEKDDLLARPHKKKHGAYMGTAKWGTVAAVVAIGLFYLGTLLFPNADPNVMLAVVEHTNTEKSVLVKTLEDGSVVYLAGQSSLEYPEHFAHNKRVVNLNGDAYFDVSKNKLRPFFIETKDTQIKVLGTAFNVQTNLKGTFSLSVERGSVMVSLKQNNSAVRVGAGQTVTLKNNRLFVNANSSVTFERYKQHIRFKDETLENVLKVINTNSSSGKILVASPAIGKRRLTVEFSESSPQTVSELVRLALNLKCARTKDTFMLSE